jgi:hypothetical protein
MAAKAKTDEKATTTADRARTTVAQPATVTSSDIAHRAYDLYLARGCEHGYDVADWLEAEQELRETVRSMPA